MVTIWLTYAWNDNKNRDVDYIAQELEESNIRVKLDRWNIQAGSRLWEQIERFIQNKNECDAWLIYATNNSLGSEACKEELAYALDRALHSRGDIFPIIGLLPSTIDESLIPASIRIRRYVSLQDPDWKERILAAAEKRELEIPRSFVDPYYLHIHTALGNEKCVIEVRPRAGTWSPVIVAIPVAEKDEINFHLAFGPKGQLPRTSMNKISGDGIGLDGEWRFLKAENEVTPTQSCFIYLNKAPSKILFGPSSGYVYIVPIIQDGNESS